MTNPVSPIRIEVIQTKYLVAQRIKMSLVDDKTAELWQQFMLKRQAIVHTCNTDLYSVEYFPCSLSTLTPNTLFEKWAAVEVKEFADIPTECETLVIESGLYAVFIHHGPANTFLQTLQTIFTQWFPTSGYQYDQRPQFEVMSKSYRPDDVDATEEIWIPIVQSC